MDEEILKRVNEQDAKLDAIYKSVEKSRKYFLWSMIVTVGMIVLPLIGLAIILPWFIKTITSAYNIGGM